MHHPTNKIAHITAFVSPVVEHWLEREIFQWVHPMKERSDDPSHHERTLFPRSYISTLKFTGILHYWCSCSLLRGDAHMLYLHCSSNLTTISTTFVLLGPLSVAVRYRAVTIEGLVTVHSPPTWVQVWTVLRLRLRKGGALSCFHVSPYSA